MASRFGRRQVAVDARNGPCRESREARTGGGARLEGLTPPHVGMPHFDRKFSRGRSGRSLRRRTPPPVELRWRRRGRPRLTSGAHRRRSVPARPTMAGAAHLRALRHRGTPPLNRLVHGAGLRRVLTAPHVGMPQIWPKFRCFRSVSRAGPLRLDDRAARSGRHGRIHSAVGSDLSPPWHDAAGARTAHRDWRQLTLFNTTHFSM